MEFVRNMLGVVRCCSHIEARLLHSMFPGSMSGEAECLSLMGAHKTQVYDQQMCIHMASYTAHCRQKHQALTKTATASSCFPLWLNRIKVC